MRSRLPALPLLLAVWAAVLASPGAARAEISADASLSSNQVGTGEPFQLSIQVVTDDKSGELPWPKVEGLERFSSVTKNSNTSRSSSTTIINGKVTQRNLFITTFTYSLTAKTPGNYLLGPIRYTHNDFDKMLGSATVTVVKQEAGLTLIPTLSKRQAYLGEQVLYNLRIEQGPQVQQIEAPQEVIQKLIGEKSWVQFLDKTVSGKQNRNSATGQVTTVYDIRVALFPLLAGKNEIGGPTLKYHQVSRTQRRRTGSVFDMFDEDFFGGGNVVQLTATAPTLPLEVHPLPPGAPRGFTGSVGDYSVTASLDKSSLPSGDAVTLTVTIRGDGQPKSVTKPILPDLGQFEVFDPEVSSSTVVQGSSLITTKTFKYVMVPRRKGEYTLGPVAFPYFQPRQKAYVEAKSPTLTLAVTEGKEVAASSSRIMSQREIADIGSDIRHIKAGHHALAAGNDYLYKRAWYWLLYPPAPLALALLLVARRRSRRLESDATLKRKTQASLHLRKRLKEAAAALQQKNSREVYKALSQAIVGFASDKLNVEFRGLPMEEAKAALRRHGLSEEAVQEYEKVLQHCDFGQFAGGGKDEKAWREALTGAENLIKRLEREL